MTKLWNQIIIYLILTEIWSRTPRRLRLDRFSQTRSNFKSYEQNIIIDKCWSSFTMFNQFWLTLTTFISRPSYLTEKILAPKLIFFFTSFILIGGSPSSELAHDDHMPQLTSKFNCYQNYCYVETNIFQISIKSNSRSSNFCVNANIFQFPLIRVMDYQELKWQAMAASQLAIITCHFSPIK